MVVTIHQPQYLPWLPYFLKAAQADVFVLLDSVDFQKNGLQNRNQIKTAQGAQWLTVPVLQRLGQKISEVHIDNKADWRKKHWMSIKQNYGKAAAFKHYAEELEEVFAREWSSLNELNIFLLGRMFRWLGIDRESRRSTDLQCSGSGSELVLNICLKMGAKQYVSGIGGHDYLDEKAFNDAGVEIVYLPPQVPAPYPQLHPHAGHLGGLSALDIVLNCGLEYRNYLPTDVLTA